MQEIIRLRALIERFVLEDQHDMADMARAQLRRVKRNLKNKA